MACDCMCLCLFKCQLVRAFRSGIEEQFAIELHYRANQRHLMLDHSLNGAYAFMEWQGERIYYQCGVDDVKTIVDHVIKVKKLEGFVAQEHLPVPASKFEGAQTPVQICRALERVVNLPPPDAARELGLSLRAFKRQLRAVGIDYWPGRMARGMTK